MAILDAEFNSNWEEEIITTKCKIDTEDCEVFDIETVEVNDNDLGSLINQDIDVVINGKSHSFIVEEDEETGMFYIVKEEQASFKASL